MPAAARAVYRNLARTFPEIARPPIPALPNPSRSCTKFYNNARIRTVLSRGTKRQGYNYNPLRRFSSPTSAAYRQPTSLPTRQPIFVLYAGYGIDISSNNKACSLFSIQSASTKPPINSVVHHQSIHTSCRASALAQMDIHPDISSIKQSKKNRGSKTPSQSPSSVPDKLNSTAPLNIPASSQFDHAPYHTFEHGGGSGGRGGFHETGVDLHLMAEEGDEIWARALRDPRSVSILTSNGLRTFSCSMDLGTWSFSAVRTGRIQGTHDNVTESYSG
jgi:hypothetical protein